MQIGFTIVDVYLCPVLGIVCVSVAPQVEHVLFLDPSDVHVADFVVVHKLLSDATTIKDVIYMNIVICDDIRSDTLVAKEIIKQTLCRTLTCECC